jgi:hypothetical protein
LEKISYLDAEGSVGTLGGDFVTWVWYPTDKNL